MQFDPGLAAYRGGSTLTAFALGAEFGGPVGVLASGVFMMGEMVYDTQLKMSQYNKKNGIVKTPFSYLPSGGKMPLPTLGAKRDTLK